MDFFFKRGHMAALDDLKVSVSTVVSMLRANTQELAAERASHASTQAQLDANEAALATLKAELDEAVKPVGG